MSYKLIEAIKQIDYNDLANKALWTFVQGFLAVVLIASASIIDLLFKGDWIGLYTLAVATTVAGIAAGLSALKTIILGVIKELKSKA